MAGLTRCLVPSEVTWEEKVILMPSPYYCYIVTSETGVWWVGVTPLGRSQAHGGVKAHTHTHIHPESPLHPALSQAIVNAQTKVDSAGSDHHSPRGECKR